MLSNKYQRLPCSSIVILRDERQRREITTDDLEHSIATRGVLQPIIVEKRADGQVYLIAGERRLTTSLKLGLADIPVRFANELPDIERQIIELEENVRRKDLHWKDQISAVLRLHNIYLGDDPEWTQSKTAQALGIDPGLLSKMLRVGKELESPKIQSAPTFMVAFNMLSRQDDRRIADAMSDITMVGMDLTTAGVTAAPTVSLDLSVPSSGPSITAQPVAPALPTIAEAKPASESILNVDFLEWAPQYSGPPFNFIHCDFPYGINVFAGKQSGREAHTTYNDSPDVYWALIKCFCANLDKLMSHSAHMVFWFGMQHYQSTLDIFRELAPGLTFQPRPLIWVKSDNVGVLEDPRRGPRNIYETAFIVSREDRFIIRAKSNAYSSPTDKAHHHSTKPEPMLRNFFEMFVDEHTRMLDPTCGSGSSLRAAESLGAEVVLGLEKDPEHAANATTALKTFRALRKLSK